MGNPPPAVDTAAANDAPPSTLPPPPPAAGTGAGPNPDGAPARRETTPSLKKLALTGSAWTLVGLVSTQAIRFASSLILTRLLFPEAFGLMTLVTTFLVGLTLLSDIGISTSIVQNPRGEEPAFFNTAWTIQSARGVLLWIGSCLLAWPLAQLYSLPDLLWALPVTGLTAVAQGFASTALATRNRQLVFGRITLIEVGTQAASTVFMLVLALAYRSVWVLIAGNILSASARTIASHVFLPGHSNRFAWDREAAVALIRFGRWIFVATILTFFCLSADRLILGYFMSSSELGIYSIAFMMSQVVMTMVQSIADKIIFPVYARWGDCDSAVLKAKVARVRQAVLAAALPGVCVLAVGGPALIDVLYDHRYQGAGWMLRILAIGSIIPITATTLSPLVLARGDSFRHMVVMALRLAITIAAMIGGGLSAGSVGLVAGYAMAPLFSYPVLVIAVYRPFGVWMPWMDLAAVVVPLAVISLGVWAVG